MLARHGTVHSTQHAVRAHRRGRGDSRRLAVGAGDHRSEDRKGQARHCDVPARASPGKIVSVYNEGRVGGLATPGETGM